MTDATSLLREPWERLERQRQAGKFGIWVFLASETLFFGALLLTYTVCRVEHPDAFAAAGRETNIWFGTINTAILLTSSLTMAVASQAAAQNVRARQLVLACLGATAALGVAFMIVKGFEYKEDIDKHLVPGAGFDYAGRRLRLCRASIVVRPRERESDIDSAEAKDSDAVIDVTNAK